MNVGRVIHVLRRERGLTLEAVALEAGTDPGNLSRIEKGLRQPSLKLLERLAAALKTSVSSICVAAEEVASEGGRTEAAPEDADFLEESVELRRCFRGLSPANRRLTVEMVKLLARHQQSQC